MDFTQLRPSKGKVYIETYGCQMNVGDSQVVASILMSANWQIASSAEDASVILLNTCAIRDNAEQKIFGRLIAFHAKRYNNATVGVIGCMAERLGEELFEKADLVVGPDAYRSLPQLIEQAMTGHKAIDTTLSIEETYQEIEPVRTDNNGISAFVSIMRGCNNFCSYCVVPYTRGRERSRPAATILAEVQSLVDNGYREVTILGQNVNSYNDNGITFAQLLTAVAAIDPMLRVRFSTSHPKDLSDELIETMAKTPNIARAIHLPAQSGSDEMLRKMNRKYTRAWYLERMNAIRAAMPDCVITTDLIAGFSGETEEDHKATLTLMREVGYAYAFMYAYSERPGTVASKNMQDDVPQEVKIRRLNEIIALQSELSLASNRQDIGKIEIVLVEGRSKRSDEQLVGRTSGGKVVVFDRTDGIHAGSYAKVEIKSCSSATLKGTFVKS